MDFIVSLPKSEGCGSILVVVDRFTKYATFIPAPADCNAEEAARLFMKHVVKYWGIPKSIISDRDTRFTGKLWTELFRLLGSQLNFSTSFHPQTDGQTERVGRCGCFVEPRRGIESSKWAIFGKQNWRCGMNRKPGYGAQLRANLEPTKGVGRLRQQDGGHGSRNPLRSV
ncbi:unnamed protein product [Prunus armeniaca]